MNVLKLLVIALATCTAWSSPLRAQEDGLVVETVTVTASKSERTTRLPGELTPYQRVAIISRVPAFVESVHVDRGSTVHRGELLVSLSAPELEAQIAEAAAKAQAVKLQLAEARAKLVSAQTTSGMLKSAAETLGAVSVVELTLAGQAFEAARAVVEAAENTARAAQSSADAMAKLGSYLRVTAAFDGVVTERLVHPGALVGPGTGGVAMVLLYLEEIIRLRLIVSVPEADVAGITIGERVTFSVRARPGAQFEGTVARVSQSIDAKTRTMAVEADVINRDQQLTAGMFADVSWSVRMDTASLRVPLSSVVRTAERMFVIRVRNGIAEFVSVTRGTLVGDLVEVQGDLQAGDVIVHQGSDEIRQGTRIVSAR